MPDSVMRIARDGWRLGLLSMTSMPLLSGTAYVAVLLWGVVTHLVGWDDPAAITLGAGFILVVAAGQLMTTIIAASILIAVHRIIILGELADRPVWRVPPTYPRFAVWLLFLNVLWFAPTVLNIWLSPYAVHSIFGPSHPILGNLASLLCRVFAFIVSLRLMILLPALALDTPSADWRNAWADSKGHVWKFFGCQVVAGLPLVAIGLLFLWGHGLHRLEGGWQLISPLETLIVCYVGGAVASRLFWNYGATLKT
jgi:hypothetical protein